jgi:uncharacterized membrane protein
MMMNTHALLLTIHIISSTVLFGLGAGTAFHMLATHFRGDIHAIASTARNVVLADWLFTSTSGVVQPVTGVALAWTTGYPLLSSWLVASYVLYVVAGLCWLPVVVLQMRMERLAAEAVASRAATLPPAYHRAFWIWFWLGWPAFIGLVIVFWLMVAKPTLW